MISPRLKTLCAYNLAPNVTEQKSIACNLPQICNYGTYGLSVVWTAEDCATTAVGSVYAAGFSEEISQRAPVASGTSVALPSIRAFTANHDFALGDHFFVSAELDVEFRSAEQWIDHPVGPHRTGRIAIAGRTVGLPSNCCTCDLLMPIATAFSRLVVIVKPLCA